IWCGTGLQVVSNVINDFADAFDEIANIITDAVIDIFNTIILLITSITNPTAFFQNLGSLFKSLLKLLFVSLFNVLQQFIVAFFHALGMDFLGNFLAVVLVGLCDVMQGVLDSVVTLLKILTLGLDSNIQYINMCCGG